MGLGAMILYCSFFNSRPSGKAGRFSLDGGYFKKTAIEDFFLNRRKARNDLGSQC
jgi:hypothetical protein